MSMPLSPPHYMTYTVSHFAILDSLRLLSTPLLNNHSHLIVLDTSATIRNEINWWSPLLCFQLFKKKCSFFVLPHQFTDFFFVFVAFYLAVSFAIYVESPMPSIALEVGFQMVKCRIAKIISFYMLLFSPAPILSEWSVASVAMCWKEMVTWLKN